MNKKLHPFLQQNFLKPILALLIGLFFFESVVQAVNKTFTGIGNFSDAARWGGTLPVAGDVLRIDGTCTFDNAANSFAYGTLQIGRSNNGVLQWPTGGTNTLNVTGILATTVGFTGSIDMTNGGTLQIGATNWITTGQTFTPGAGTIIWVDAAGNSVLPAAIDTYNNLTIIATGRTASLGVATTINGNLLISAGTLSTTGSNYALTLKGDFTNNATFNGNASVVNFNGSTSQSITGSGAITFATLKSNNSTGVSLGKVVTITTLTVADATSGSVFNDGGYGILTATTLNLNSGTYNCTAATFPWNTLNAGTGTINYGAAGNQTVGNNNYYNLTLSGGGTKTLQTGTTNIVGNLTVDNATATAVTALSIGGDVILKQGSVFTGGVFTHNVAGNWTNNGWTNFIPGTGTINFTGNNSAINGSQITQTFNNLIVAKTNNQVLSVGSSITTLNVTGNLTMNSGSFAPGTTSTVISGNWTNNGGTLTAGTGIIRMNGSGKTIGGTTSTSFNNLDINNNAGGILLGVDQFVNGTLSLSNGLLKLGSYNLTIGLSAPAVSGIFHSQNMIIAVGLGELRKQFSANGSYVFPIGDGTTVSPMTLNFTQGAYDAGAYAGVRVTNSMHPQNTSPNYLKRYWSVSQSGIHSFLCNVTGNYVYADIVGAENLQNAVEYNGSLPWLIYSPLASYTLIANGVDTFGDFTGIGLPNLSSSVASLDGFTYIHYYGPSTQLQQFNVTAQSLANNVVVTAPSDFEISTSWIGPYQTAITLNQSAGNVNSIIYVRLKAGLSVGNYSNRNIVISSVGMSPINILLTNATVTQPTFCLPTGDNTGYSITMVKIGIINNITAKPAGYTDYSATQSTDLVPGNTYQLTVKVNTSGNNPVGAKAWIDWNNGGFTNNSGYQTYDLGTVTNTTNGNTSLSPVSITVPVGASMGPLRMRVACLYYWPPFNACDNNSEVEDYTLNIVNQSINTGTISGFPFCAGASVSVPFTIDGTFTAGNVFTAHLSNASGSFTSPINIGTITSTASGTISGTIPSNTIAGIGYRIRVIGNNPATTGSDNGTNFTVNTLPSAPVLGAITQPTCATATGSVALSGLPAATWTLTSTPGALTQTGSGTTATFSGLSAATTYTFTVTLTSTGCTSAASGNVLINAQPLTPSITGTTPGSRYGAGSVTLSATSSGILNWFDVPSGGSSLYTGASFTTPSIASSTTYYVDATNGSCTSARSSVLATVNPVSITAGGGGSSCEGSTVNLTSSGTNISNLYWTGPNNYYSLDPNPVLSGLTANMDGVYTVTGSYLNGSNLITNGDFQSGKTGFTTDYTLAAPTSTGLTPESTYDVIALPSSRHGNFCSCGDHTTGTGLQLVINGASSEKSVWSQTVTVSPNADYQFTYYLQTVVSGNDANPSKLQLYVNGIAAGPVYTANSTTGVWTQFTYNWSAGSGVTSAQLSLKNENFVASGNDFALDDIVFQRVVQSTLL